MIVSPRVLQQPRGRVRPRKGVTLMELVVALTITGLMAAAGAATFGSIIDSKRIVRESTADTERAAALRETLRQWMLSATFQIQQGGVPGGGRGGQAVRVASVNAATRTQNGAEAVTAAAATGDELTFLTSAPNPANSPNARMRLFIDGDDATPEHGLTIEYQASTQTPLQRLQLDSTVQTMTVEFLDGRTSRWLAASQAATIQQMLAVRVNFTSSEGALLPALLQLPMTFAMTNVRVQAPQR